MVDLTGTPKSVQKTVHEQKNGEHPRQRKRMKKRPEVTEKSYLSSPKARYHTVCTILNSTVTDDISRRQKMNVTFIQTVPKFQRDRSRCMLLSIYCNLQVFGDV